jgi:hypothetical protein
MNHQNNCQNRRQEITAFVLCVLEQKDADELKKHLEICQNCRSFYQAMLDEEKTIRSTFKMVADKGKAVQSSLLAQLDKKESVTSQAETSPAKTTKITWGKIIKSPLTKIAATAVIITAIALLLHNGSMNITTPAFGLDDITAAIQNENWLHSTMIITELNWDDDEKKKIGDISESWVSVNPALSIDKHSDGKISFAEKDTAKTSIYDPKSNTITIEYEQTSNSQESYSSISDMFRAQIADLKDHFDQVKYEESILNGQPVTIICLDVNNATEGHGLHSIISIAVNPDTYLPVQMTIEQSTLRKDKSGKVIILCDYPKNGPRDIYEAGAPRDAKVIIVDKRGDPDTIEALKPYKNARENLVSKYILVSTYGDKSKIDEVRVMYIDGKHERSETHYVFKPGDAYYEMWPVYSAAMGRTFDSLLQWSQQNMSGSSVINIYDGKYEYVFKKDDNNEWTAKEKEFSPYINPGGELASLGWQIISNDTKVIETEFSREHGFLCFEKYTEAEIEDNTLIESAQRQLYYIDPQHDYILIRQERYGHRTIDERPSLDEIDFDPQEVPTEPYYVSEVVEFVQIDTGQWYPKKIEYSSRGWDQNGVMLPLRLTGIRTILLETNREIPADIFDPNKIIPEAGQVQQSLKESYSEIVKEIISKIDSLDSWPEPTQLAVGYWQARNKKDYDTMALYWPGSATWNEKLLADEKPVEYVFGVVQYPDYGGAFVPYAEKSYFLKNQKFNLKMWFKNEGSVKGRYYIISGN